MNFAHLRRLGLSCMFIVALAVLALFIEGAVVPIHGLVMATEGVESGPWGAIPDMVLSMAFLLVPMLLLDVIVWILIGPVQRTRVEQEERRLRR